MGDNKPKNHMTILQGDSIAFAPGQLDDQSLARFARIAENLGATVTDDLSAATIILTNPGSPEFRMFTASDPSSSAASSSASKAVRVPYHWLAHCQSSKTRIDPSLPLTPAKPYLQQSSASKLGHPVRVWVSVNIERRPPQVDPQATRDEVEADLARAGALIVAKRADADVLVVDRKSQFYKTVRHEMQTKGREWQRIAERAWVDACLRAGKFLSTSTGEKAAADAGSSPVKSPIVGKGKGKGGETGKGKSEERSDDGYDTFAEEEKRAARGPGRPTGGKRTDYTPADDEFMCRYLAYHYPDGAWQSRKTYAVMFDRQDEYPVAARHSAQSWHERFKKNAGSFRRRVELLTQQGLDAKMRTKKERERAKEMAAEAKDKAKEIDGGADANAVAADVAVNAESSTTGNGKRRRLIDDNVDSGSDTERAVPQVKKKKQVVAASDVLGRQRDAGHKPSSSRAEVDTGGKPTAEGAAEVEQEPVAAVVATETTVTAVVETAEGEPVVVEEAVAVVEVAVEAAASAAPPSPPPSTAEPPAGQAAPSIQPTQSDIGDTNGHANGDDGDGEDPMGSAAAQREAATVTEQHDTLASLPPPPPRRMTTADEIAYTLHRRRSSTSKANKKVDRVNAYTTAPATYRPPPPPPETTQPPATPVATTTQVTAVTTATTTVADATPPKPPAPKLTDAEWRAKVASGAELANAHKEDYRARVLTYASKYNLGASQVVAIMSSLPRRKAGAFWVDIEAGFQEKFGF